MCLYVALSKWSGSTPGVRMSAVILMQFENQWKDKYNNSQSCCCRVMCRLLSVSECNKNAVYVLIQLCQNWQYSRAQSMILGILMHLWWRWVWCKYLRGECGECDVEFGQCDVECGETCTTMNATFQFSPLTKRSILERVYPACTHTPLTLHPCTKTVNWAITGR